MNKFYLNAGCKGYLKHIPLKEHQVKIYNVFTKNKTLAKICNNKDEAIVYQKELITWLESNIDYLGDKLVKAAYVYEHWNDFKTSIDRVTYVNCVGCDEYEFRNRNADYSKRWIASGEKVVRDIRNAISFCSKLKKIVNKIKLQEEEAEILFYANKKVKVKWVDSPKEISRPGQRLYCNCCGGVIPDIKYFYLGSTSYNGSSTYLCAFCINRLAGEVKNVIANIPEEVKAQYEADRFLKLL